MEKRKPNIVFFVPDEMRGDLVGNPHIQLPNLDDLRQDGVTFKQSFAVNPVCAPSRCCTFTGQYPTNGGHRGLFQLLRPHEQNLFRLFKEDGYNVHFIGKNHLFTQETEVLSVTERKCTAEEMFQMKIENTAKQLSSENHSEIEQHIRSSKASPWPEGHRFKKSFYFGEMNSEEVENDIDHAYIRSALAFLDNPPSEPFVLYVGLNFPHPPYHVEEPYFSMYDREKMPSPIRPLLDDKPEFMRLMYERYGLDILSEADFKEIIATYYGMASRVDDQLGQVVKKLKEKDLYEDTAVFFFSDHGDYVGDYGLTEKWPVGFQDCLMNVPLVIKMPDQIGAGRTTNALTELIDILPTSLEIADIETPYTHFGLSLLPMIHGEREEHRDAVFGVGGYNLREPQCFEGLMPGSVYAEKLQIAVDNSDTVSRATMIRTKDHKLVIRSGGKEELYDMKRDPQETKNLIDDPLYVDIQTELRNRLLKWYLETSDNPHWERTSEFHT